MLTKIFLAAVLLFYCSACWMSPGHWNAPYHSGVCHFDSLMDTIWLNDTTPCERYHCSKGDCPLIRQVKIPYVDGKFINH